MKYPIQIEKINSSIEFYDEVIYLVNESKKYLESYKWCKKIHDGWLFTNLGYVLNIFLYKIDNVQSPEDDLTWVIVGDFPPMYLDTFNVFTTKEVVENYVWLVDEWIQNAESGKSFKDCFPLESDISKESLDMLKSRIKRLEESINPSIENVAFSEAFK